MTQPNPPSLLQTGQPSRGRQIIALIVAILADGLHYFAWPLFFAGGISPFEWAEDLIVTVILLIILGFRWELIAAFGLELVPFIDMFPTWTAFMLYIMADSHRRSAPGFPVPPPSVQGGTPPPPALHPPITVERIK